MHVEVVKSTSIVDLQPHQISVVDTCELYKISQIQKLNLLVHAEVAKSTSIVDLIPSIHQKVYSSYELTLPPLSSKN